MLERKCSQLYFTISRKAENVTKAVIKKVELSEITLSPVSAVVCEALPTDVGGGTYDFPASTFAQGDQPYEYTVADEVLPKADAPFGLAMQVVFNSATEATDLMLRFPLWRLLPVFVTRRCLLAGGLRFADVADHAVEYGCRLGHFPGGSASFQRRRRLLGDLRLDDRRGRLFHAADKARQLDRK